MVAVVSDQWEFNFAAVLLNGNAMLAKGIVFRIHTTLIITGD